MILDACPDRTVQTEPMNVMHIRMSVACDFVNVAYMMVAWG